jgi:hypothetical protein
MKVAQYEVLGGRNCSAGPSRKDAMKVARYEVPGGAIVGWVRPAGTQ